MDDSFLDHMYKVDIDQGRVDAIGWNPTKDRRFLIINLQGFDGERKASLKK